MHIGFYLPTKHLQGWDWAKALGGLLPLSGTDGSVLRIADYLATRNHVTVDVLVTQTGSSEDATSAHQVSVPSFKEAVYYAEANDLDALVFPHPTQRERFPDVRAGLEEADTCGVPCLTWLHNTPPLAMSTAYASHGAVKRALCVSNPQADLLRDRAVFNKVAVVHNPIDTRFFAKADTSCQTNNLSQYIRKTVCYAGALTKAKGFHHVARAWPTVRNAVPKAELSILGSARLYDRTASLGPLQIGKPEYEQEHLIPYLGPNREAAKNRGVTLYGLLAPHQLRIHMQQALVGVVNPSFTTPETFCVTAAEFQAAGTAVVGGRMAGLRETVADGHTGRLIRSPDDLAEVLIALLKSPQTTRAMGRRGQIYVRDHFDTPHVAERFRQILESVVRNEPPSPPSFQWKYATPRNTLREGIRQLGLRWR